VSAARRGAAGPAFLLAAALAALLSACAGGPRIVSGDAEPAPIPEAITRFREPGEISWTVDRGTFASEFGCTVEYETMRPAEPRTDVMVIIAHGFARDLTRMRGWAEQWASRGIPATVVSFCNSKFYNGYHDRNGADLVALAGLLGVERVVYAGFSAGGLAALIAASTDPRTVAYLGLDAVDSGELASAFPAPAAPACFLFGEPSSCNAEGNMVAPASRISGALLYGVSHASHCHFELPYDAACERFCGGVEPDFVSDRIVDAVVVAATAWIESVTGVISGGEFDEVMALLVAGANMRPID
jgi:pimeloyl-ACP methyl ester carboxylesterase